MIKDIVDEFSFMTEMERYDTFLHLYHSKDPEDAAALEALYQSPDPLIPLILLRFLEEIPEKKACVAVIHMLAHPNDVVVMAAQAAYTHSHYPGKPQLLKGSIFSPLPKVCKFAVRTLSRAGFMDILPLLLREIPERKGPVLKVMIDAVRYLPHRRSISIIHPLAFSEDEKVRFLSVEVLADLQTRTRAVPLSLFMDRLKDESDRVRRAALDALQRYSSRKVEPLIMQTAQRVSEPETSRIRAIRALSAFPSIACVRALTRIAADTSRVTIRLAVEIVLRHFSAPILRKGLLPCLREKDVKIRRQAAIFLADYLGRDPQVREALFDVWRGCDETLALEFIEPLQILGGADTVALLRQAVVGDPVLAYAAATALAQLRGEVSGKAILEMIENPAMTALVRQALLDRWAKRGPDADVREAVLKRMLVGLSDATPNNRYLSSQILGWYPLDACLRPFLDLLAREPLRDVIYSVSAQITQGLGYDPLPLARELAVHPHSGLLIGHVVRILLGQAWDPGKADELLSLLDSESIRLSEKHPKRFAAICLHLYENSGVTLQDLWPRLGEGARRRQFLRMLHCAIRNPMRRLPQLGAAFLELQMALVDAQTRLLLYDLLAVEGREECVEFLTAVLLREEDPACRARGTTHLRGLLRGAAE